MGIDLTVPEWLQSKVGQWKDALHMAEWEVAIGLALTPNGNADCLALADQFPDLNFGRIVFRADIENNRFGEETIVHELLHIKHSRIDHFIEGVMIPNIDDGSLICSMTYRQLIEPYINSMAKALVDMKVKNAQ